MLLVVALGGNALLERGEVPMAEVQEKHVLAAVDALVPLARDHDLVITHGNGPQVGLLALESTSDPALPHPYPFDVLGAQTQGMIGYFLLQAFENALPGQEVVSLICQTLVAADDPAFDDPTKFVGPVYEKDEALRIARQNGWQVRPDGAAWRRVVASPEPLAMVELSTIRMVLATVRWSSAPVAEASPSPIPKTASSAASRPWWTRTSRPPFWPRPSRPMRSCSSPM